MRIHDDRTLIYDESTGGQHLANILAGSKTIGTVIDDEGLDGYRFLGIPDVYETGPVFDQAVAFAEERGRKPPIAAVLIRINGTPQPASTEVRVSE